MDPDALYQLIRERHEELDAQLIAGRSHSDTPRLVTTLARLLGRP